SEPAMRIVTGFLAVLALGGIGVRALAAATQNRPDNPAPGTRSEVILEVDTRDHYDRELAAEGLWAVCQQTVDGVRLQSFDARGDGEFAITVQPALGTNAEQRLVGCLEDFTVDRVLGDVTAVRGLEPVSGTASG
ncbi:MAG TPA: hypothetical protein VF152_05750, partial [Acidimicrobiia bacterium]